MKINTFVLIILLLILVSCKGNGQSQLSVNSIASQDSVNKIHKIIEKVNSKNILPDFLFDIWGVPHSAFINLRLYSNGKFLFNDYTDEGLSIVKEGKYDYRKGYVTLYYKNGSSLKLEFCKNDNEYFLYDADRDYSLIKGLGEQNTDNQIDEIYEKYKKGNDRD